MNVLVVCGTRDGSLCLANSLIFLHTQIAGASKVCLLQIHTPKFFRGSHDITTIKMVR
jgi:hypothetical protein